MGDEISLRSFLGLHPLYSQSSIGLNPEVRFEDYGLKGRGFFGQLPRSTGGVSSELSIGVDLDGKQTEIPSMVPTLTLQELRYLLSGEPVTAEIAEKARMWALTRQAQGLNPFAQQQELRATPGLLGLSLRELLK